jgi:GNAT superfamily N-acetyltransferase
MVAGTWEHQAVGLSLVPATEADRTFFIRAHHEAYRSTVEQQFGWDDEIQDAAAPRAFDGGGILVVVRDGERVGVVGWEARPGYYWLKELFILPEHHRQGVGGAVVERLLALAGEAEVRLRTLASNHGAVRLYERHGFVVDEVTDTH